MVFATAVLGTLPSRSIKIKVAGDVYRGLQA